MDARPLRAADFINTIDTTRKYQRCRVASAFDDFADTRKDSMARGDVSF
jgi:hypothetical protein